MKLSLLEPLRSFATSERRALKTARCLLVDGDRHLLVVHAGRGRHRDPVWGLPGGHIDPGEAPDVAARRELREELYLSVQDLSHIDDYPYKGSWHRVYSAGCQAAIERFDDRELLEIAWFTVEDVQELADAGALHAGYEIDVIRQVRSALEPLRAAS